ncbi:MAG: M43 family zinc metalloprotease [Bacteroidota bacterium]|nr:M43 family zinc metalloprotease [Bacteroidota bacterium]
MLRNSIIFFLLIATKVFSQVEKTEVFTGCASGELLKKNEALNKVQNLLDNEAYKYFSKGSLSTQRGINSIANIPVVVHIIHNSGPENISDAQVQTAIAHLNANFALSNNYQIQFCLAQRDPNGNATTGITRNTSPLTTETMEVDDIALKDINRWPPTCYLNIWIVKEILSQSSGSGVVGYAYFPSAAGLNMDGIVIEADYFGTSVANDAVGTHEVGHYLGLYHTFQNGCSNSDCLQDGDKVCDTPPDQTTFASCNPSSNSCSTDADDLSTNNPFTTDVADLGEDYMDYSNFSCYNQFTPGQYSRMEFFLTTTRSSLLGCLSCNTPCPNPVIATITSPAAVNNITTGTTLNFTGTATNSVSNQWYLAPSTILSTNLSTSYTFNTAGTYWMKFKANSGNLAMCTNDIDSVKIIVSEPVVAACGGSLLFDIDNPAVALPLNNQYYSGDNGGYTWECWFKLNQPFGSAPRVLIASVDGVVFEDQWLGFGWQGGFFNEPVTKLVFRVDGPNSTMPSAPSCSYSPLGGFIIGTWYHAAGVMNYTTQQSKLFVNGVLVDTKSVTTPPITRIIPTELSYNWSASPLPLYGNMDEVRIWNRPLSDAEVANGYNQCMSGNEQNLLAYYRCNQTAGSSVMDATANSLDGTFEAATGWATPEPQLISANCIAACLEICGNGIDDNNNGQVDEGCACPNVVASNDTIVCQGGGVQLNSSSGFTTYSWLPTAGLNDATVADPIASPLVTTSYTVTATTPGVNLVVNPDFSSGNVGFTSGHNFTTSYAPCNYFVGPSFFNVYPQLTDHTPTTDNMFMHLDGCTSGPTIIWEQTVYALAGNTNYAFSFWASRSDVSQPIFEIHFIGDVTGDVVVAINQGIVYTGVWAYDEYGVPLWNSGLNTSVTIKVINTSTAGTGNDFGLDDFSFNKLCYSTDTVTVSAISTVAPTLELGNDIYMCASATHTFDAGAGFKEYHWSDGTTEQTFTAFGPGTYSVTVKDSCNNIQTDIVHIYLISAPTLSVANDATLCLGDSVQLSFTSNGVFTNLLWSPSIGLSCTNCVNPFVKTNVTTTYYLVASTSEGCTVMDSAAITIYNNIPQTILTTLPCNTSNGTIELSGVSGGVPPYQYNFNNLGFSSATIYTGLNPSNYPLTVKDVNGCAFDTTLVFISNPLSPSSVSYLTTDATCTPNGSITIQSVTGGIPPYVYDFNNSGFSSTTYYSPLNAGTYTLVVKDNQQCTLDVSVTVLSASSGPSDLFFITTEYTCEEGGSVTVSVNGGTAPYLFSLNNTSYTASTIFSNLNEGIYSISVIDDNSCIYDSSFTIKALIDEEMAYIPNCFTPNSDIYNEKWFITGTCIKSISCRIFNRWGEEIAVLNKITDTWDGLYKNKIVQDGVYFYIVDIIFYTEREERRSGSITLLR